MNTYSGWPNVLYIKDNSSWLLLFQCKYYHYAQDISLWTVYCMVLYLPRICTVLDIYIKYLFYTHMPLKQWLNFFFHCGTETQVKLLHQSHRASDAEICTEAVWPWVCARQAILPLSRLYLGSPSLMLFFTPQPGLAVCVWVSVVVPCEGPGDCLTPNTSHIQGLWKSVEWLDGDSESLVCPMWTVSWNRLLDE